MTTELEISYNWMRQNLKELYPRALDMTVFEPYTPSKTELIRVPNTPDTHKYHNKQSRIK